ncbi:OLC1v1023856C1 [Oldenlandia corymbosa var. corymbosa]|uniref:OLC1v1023856C1 n=1 Tax=Oldenlandia corymbosa var. corymbosa TaxID=529605 RepID=A0AAV1C1U7_OLDCO|nr:OLC1v1023856C1 [Oldenlandia corymbosa var. corymbosa]
MAKAALGLLLTLFLLSQTNAQTTPAPGPAAEDAGPINVTAILAKPGQFSQFIRFLNETQVATQINNQVNNSNQGMTVFAPTDNAFQNLPGGALNNLTNQQKVLLILYHVLPQYYTLTTLSTASNPVRTQASDNDGKPFVLLVSGEVNQNQVNVTSSDGVQTTIYNTVRKDYPLAIFQVDKVLWPAEFNESKAEAPAPATTPKGGSPKGSSNGTATAAAEPAPGNGAQSVKVGLGLVSGLWVLCMGLLF